MIRTRSSALMLGLSLLLAGTPIAEACTSLRLMTADGYPIYGRTMEFASATIPWQLAVYPRGTTYQGLAPNGQKGLGWTGRYGFVGALAAGVNEGAVSDGMNERGLVVGLLILYGSKYQTPKTDADVRKTVAYWQLGNYLLSNFATVAEVRTALTDNIIVADVPLPASAGLGSLPVHYVVHDADGNALAVEYIDGQLRVHDNPLGVLTNDPRFEWQMENLTFYTDLPLDRRPPVQRSAGAKAAAQGLDVTKQDMSAAVTSPNRFVKAAVWSLESLPPKNADQGITRVATLMNNFDIPEGTKLYRGPLGAFPESTAWTAIGDMKNRRYFFRTEFNPNWRMIDLSRVDFGKGQARAVALPPLPLGSDISDLVSGR